MKNSIFNGAATALITPFKNGKVDYKAFEKIVDEQINAGIDALVFCGTTGEGSTLTDEEHREVLEFGIKYTNGRVPVIAGTGSNDTAYARELSIFASEAGADGLLLVTPYYNKATQKGLIKQFLEVADNVDIPIILYNVPSRTGVNIEPETYTALTDHKNIAAIKEANGNIEKIVKTASLVGDKLDIYSGNDDQIIPILSLGGKGVISVLSNIFPKETHDIVALWNSGKQKEARELQFKFLPLIKALFCEVNPIPIKAAMAYLGYCDPEIRLPLTEMESDNFERLKAELKKLGK